jgi:hypothetical protein
MVCRATKLGLPFDQSRIIEDGTRDELLAREGHYFNLWNRQAAGFFRKAKRRKVDLSFEKPC